MNENNNIPENDEPLYLRREAAEDEPLRYAGQDMSQPQMRETSHYRGLDAPVYPEEIMYRRQDAPIRQSPAPKRSGALVAVLVSVIVVLAGALGGMLFLFGSRQRASKDSKGDTLPDSALVSEAETSETEEKPERSEETASPDEPLPEETEKPEPAPGGEEVSPGDKGSSESTDHAEDFSPSGNITNGGRTAFDGEYYYLSESGTGPVVRQSLSGSETVIYDGYANYMNVSGDYLYLCTGDEHGVYRMKKDGSGFTCLLKSYAHELTCYGDKLYFCSDAFGSYGICRMNTDGSGLELLRSGNEWYMSIYKDRIYFTDYENGRKLWSMDLDGSDQRLLDSGSCFETLAVEDKLFYCKDGDSRNLYTMSLDGSGSKKIYSGYARYVNYAEGRIYFVDGGGSICSVKPDGSDLTTVHSSGDNISYIALQPGALFYCDLDNNTALVMMSH